MDSSKILQLENIKKSYYLGKQELPVLKGITLDIYKNDYVALMGPSGSGGRLQTPEHGRSDRSDRVALCPSAEERSGW